MLIETATLLAVVAAPLAVVAVVAAALVVLLVRRGRSGLVRSATRLEQQETLIREELVIARGSLERLGGAITSFRAQADALDTDLVAWTAGLKEQRTTIERLNRGRLRPAVQAVQMASALARITLLWRAPAR